MLASLLSSLWLYVPYLVDHFFILELFQFCCFSMTGIIWLVQLVHYPSFSYIDEKMSVSFHQFHQKSITWVVLPLMVGELVFGLVLLGNSLGSSFWILQLLGIIAIWGATFFISVPFHEKLLGINRTQPEVVRKLVNTNWIRTILWTARSLGLIFFI